MTKRAGLNAALLGSILLWAVGSWFAIRQRAEFSFGGDPDSVYEHNGVIHVDAHGWDAIAIGLVFYGLGLLNVAQAIAGRARIPVFWLGAGLFGAAAFYGFAKVALDVVETVGRIVAS